MDERAFEALAGDTLVRLAERLEDGAADLDVELQAGILTFELPDGRQYVVNKHAPNRQIWLSSPVSGAKHFGWTGESWRSTRGPERLESFLAEELSGVTGTRVDLL